jgi:hypothetical protein
MEAMDQGDARCSLLACKANESADTIDLPIEEHVMDSRPTNPADIPREPIPPELLAWARQTLDVEEFLAEVQQTVATGGVPFEQIVAEVKSIVRSK